ncbi:MAG: hypothetical protein ACI4XS_03630, partial [Bacillus sp. (in: firmicutes)]
TSKPIEDLVSPTDIRNICGQHKKYVQANRKTVTGPFLFWIPSHDVTSMKRRHEAANQKEFTLL